jgi:glycosyltransferase involved in cell wall biosynthesis
LHGRLDLPELGPLYDLYDEMAVVSISDAQRQPLPHANYVATVHHGLPQNLLQRGPGGKYLAFLGRISPEKAPDAAIRIAARARMPLKIAAKVDKVDQEYFKTKIEPLLDGADVQFIGEIGEHQKSEFLGNAAALLFPIAWREPFGLVMIEAMACGTPVIAFIVQSEAQAADALRNIRALDRGRIRAEFDNRFTAHHMAQNYIKLYSRLVKSRPKSPVIVAGSLMTQGLAAHAATIAGPGLNVTAL